MLNLMEGLLKFTESRYILFRYLKNHNTKLSVICAHVVDFHMPIHMYMNTLKDSLINIDILRF